NFSHCSRVLILFHSSRLRVLTSRIRRTMSRSIMLVASLRCSLLRTSGVSLPRSPTSSARLREDVNATKTKQVMNADLRMAMTHLGEKELISNAHVSHISRWGKVNNYYCLREDV